MPGFDSPALRPDTEANRTLVRNVHPPDWENPEPAPLYNLVVLGAGTAGLITAAGAASLGATVALVERELLGGDCLNFGCVPSKGIIRAARAVHEVRSASRFGIGGLEEASVDFGRAMERMREVRAKISSHDSARRFAEEFGIHVFLGSGRFLSPDTVEVEGARLRFRKAAICTGARAAAPPIPGLGEAGYLTNETVFSLTELPPRLAVIGGGPIGCELAQTFRRLGSTVHLFEMGPHILPREEGDAAGIVQDSLASDGVELILESRVTGVGRTETGKVVLYERPGAPGGVEVDEILVGTGRAPNVEGMGLEAAGVAYDPRDGVSVDDFLRTRNPAIYAAGDVCSSYKFTHTADAMARILIANALFLGRQRVSSLVVPWCTYTDPEIAHVGMYEREARARGIAVTTITVPLAAVDRALLDGEADGFARVHLRKGSDRILGATIVARHAGEMLGELALAVTAGTGLSAIGKTIHPYPTQAEAIRRLADAWNRTRLTPRVKRLLSAWLRWQRGG